MVAMLFLFVVVARADDPPEGLRRKPKPPSEKKDAAPAKIDDGKNDGEPKKDAPPRKPVVPPQPEPEESPEKIFERLGKNSRTASERLRDKETGDDTRKAQKDVLKDIDKLLEQLQKPPEQSDDSQDQNEQSKNDQNNRGQSGGGASSQGGGMSGGQPQGAQGQGQSRAQRRRQRGGQTGNNPMGGQPDDPQLAKGNQPMGQGTQPKGQGTQPKSQGNQPKGQGGQPKKDGDQPGGNNPQGKDGGNPGDPKNDKKPPNQENDNRIADLYKDVWGHLPDKVRQEMDMYFREKFMPRYNDLLRQYYSTIAEQNKRKDR
jgi:hypothetical protein